MRGAPRLRTAVVVAAAAAVTLGGLTACSDDPPAANGTVVLADVSQSANKGELVDSATSEFLAAVRSANAPATVTLYAFNTQVGSEDCKPLVATVKWDRNSTNVDDEKAKLVAQAPAAVKKYYACVDEKMQAPGTDIFGGIAEAANLLKNVPGTRTIELVSDGCNNSYDTDLCSLSVVDAGWRAERIKALPDSMKPDLSGITLNVSGLAKNADLNSAQVQGLKSFFSEYAEVTHAEYTTN